MRRSRSLLLRWNSWSPWKRWLLVGLAVRGVLAFQQFGWNHPDEWFQTVEFGAYWARGVMSGSQEVVWHLRNQSVPLLWGGAIACFDALGWGPRGILGGIQFLASLSFIPWLMWIRAYAARHRWSALQTQAAYSSIAIFWFWPRETLRPSGENISAALFACSLWASETGRVVACGWLSVATAAAKYPSGLLSLGPVWARRSTLKFWWGLGLGIATLGLADAALYGRAWESLWMFLQYNVFSPLGAERFGHQGLSVYLQWGSLPVRMALCLLLPGFAHAFWRALRSHEAWAQGFAAYAIAHLFVAHKEARFITPLIPFLLIFGSATTAAFLKRHVRVHLPGNFRQWGPVTIGAHLLALLPSMFGFPRRYEMTYFMPYGSHEPCAVVADVRLPSVLLPRALPYGFGSPGSTPVRWIETTPRCDSSSIAVASRSQPGASCSKLSAYGKFGWWSCPSSTLVAHPQPLHALEHTIPKILELPRLGDTPALRRIEHPTADGLWSTP